MEISNINPILFELWGYKASLLELLGTVLGICSVYLATRGKAVNFLFGIVGMTFLTFFFYQEGLYSNSILQIILICFCAFGYYNWTKPKKDGEKADKKVTVLRTRQRIVLISGILAFVGIWGSMMAFAKPEFLKTVFPDTNHHFMIVYADSFMLCAAVTAMYLRTQKKWENWFVFGSSDTIGIVLFLLTGNYFVLLMVSVYWCLDIKGIISWRKEMKHYNS
jgi:nicotinamide mononucleotide transporter